MTPTVRALVVSPRREHREEVLALLRTWYPAGFEGTQTETLPRAVQALKKGRRPTLILCEVHDPQAPLLDEICNQPSCATIGFFTQVPKDTTEADLVLKFMRRGFDDVVKYPFAFTAIDPALKKALERGQRDLRRQGGRVYSVLAAKGGAGATTVAVNLAVAHAEAGETVVVFDSSRQLGSARYFLGLEPGRDVSDAVAAGPGLSAEALQRLLTKHEKSGVHLLDAPRDLGGDLEGEGVARVVEVLQEAFDVVICDIEPGLIDTYKINLFDLSERLCLVFEATVPSVRAATTILRELAELRYPAEKLVPTLNRYDDFAGNIDAQAVADTMGTTIAAALPYERELLVAVNQGVPFLVHEPDRAFSEAIRRLALAMVPGPGPAGEELFVLRPGGSGPTGLATGRAGGLLGRLGSLFGGGR